VTPPASDSPIVFETILTSLFANGGTYAGKQIVEVSFHTVDGGEAVVKIPTVKKMPVDSQSERRKSALAQRIISFIESKWLHLSRKQISKGLGFQSASGNFGTTITWMLEQNDLIEDREGNLFTPAMDDESGQSTQAE